MRYGNVLFLVAFFIVMLVGSFGLGRTLAEMNFNNNTIDMEQVWQELF